MHTLDPKWVDLAAGYQAIQSLQAQLESEFGRALQAGRKQEFRKELTSWQKKRRVFFTLVALAPLSVITLCLAAYYLREVACVIVYWAVLVLVILITLAVAGRDYIREVMNRPEPGHGESLVPDLEPRWWASLAPPERTGKKVGRQNKVDFMTILARSLPDTFITANSLVLGESGVWLFVTRDWSGTIIRQDGAWKRVQKHRAEPLPGLAPDDEWLQQKDRIVKTIEHKLPRHAWTVSQIQGGVVFTHPKAHPEKSRLQGNTAAYGSVKAWVDRLHRTPPVDGFTPPMQLEILDALAGAGAEKTSPAKNEAERLYQQAAAEIRQALPKMLE
jgi:hypothetical protein